MTQPSRTTWATTADVLALTGSTVTDADVVRANAMVEIFAGRLYTMAATRTGARDAEWMRRAVAFQVPWIAAQPDLFERLDLATMEGLELKETGLVLAPYTKAALNKLSWRRTRSLHIGSAFVDGPGALSADPLSEVNDRAEQWSPMGGG
jgi:hypothetical protein